METNQARRLPYDALRWTETTIPESAPKIELARFPTGDPTGASSSLVRFPKGWSRPGSGHYPVHEEILLLKGDLTVSDSTYRPGDYAWLPAGYLRSASHSSEGALALARFSGPPVWIPSETPGDGFQLEAVIQKRWSNAGEHPSPLGHARLLREDDSFSSWILERDGGDADVTPYPTELFSLADHSWAWTDRNQSRPRLEMPCFCRTYHVVTR